MSWLQAQPRLTENLGPCLLWMGLTTPAGYGQIYLDDGAKRAYVHRQHWIDCNGPIPVGINVRHKCDIRNCWRLSHLCLGTSADNSRDMVERNRHQRGEDRPNSKLTDAAVLLIKRNAECLINSQWAAIYDVSEATICGIQKGKRWKHVMA